MDPTPRRQASIEDIEEIWQAADVVIEAARAIALQPESSKTLRTFTMTEVCSLLDLHPTVFYELIRQHPELGGTKTAAKRLFTLAEIHRLQGHLKKLPRQMYDIERTMMN